MHARQGLTEYLTSLSVLSICGWGTQGLLILQGRSTHQARSAGQTDPKKAFSASQVWQLLEVAAGQVRSQPVKSGNGFADVVQWTLATAAANHLTVLRSFGHGVDSSFPLQEKPGKFLALVWAVPFAYVGSCDVWLCGVCFGCAISRCVDANFRAHPPRPPMVVLHLHARCCGFE